MRRAFALLGVVGCMAGASGLGGCTSAATSAPQKAATAVKLVASNVLRDDYAGSRECGDCHAAIAARFARSPMHNMTREAAGATLRAPAEATFDFKGTLATFTVVNGARHLRYGAHDFTITRVIGGRTREDFVGRLVPTDNPLGTHALRLSAGSVLIHGTNRPFAIGRNVSHGCINLSPTNAKWFFDNFGSGDPIVVKNSVGTYTKNDGAQDWQI